jgi:hypothetical protein
VIYLIDEHVQHRVGGQGSYAAGGFWWLGKYGATARRRD